MEFDDSRKHSILRHWQSDRIECAILSIPSHFANIAAINSQAVSLRPSVVQLPYPVEAKFVVIRRLHLLRLVHLETGRRLQLLSHDFPTSKTDGAEGWLLNVVAVVCGLSHVWLLVDWLGLSYHRHGDGVVDWLLDYWLSDLMVGIN